MTEWWLISDPCTCGEKKRDITKSVKTFYFNFSQTYHRLRRKHQIQLVILANKAVLTTKEGLVQELGNDQKKEDHNGYNS